MTSPEGLPVAGATVGLDIPHRELYGYVSPIIVSNATGEFSYLVQRNMRPVVLPLPDTITVSVTAYKAASGGNPSLSGRTSVLLHFAPPDSITPVAAVTVVVTPP